MVTYPLDEVLLTTLVGVLWRADDFDEIELLGQEHLNWLRQFLPFKDGIPQAQTFRKIFRLLDPQALEKAFSSWVADLQKQISGDAIIATDAGNFSSWLHRHFQFGEKHTLLGAVAGAMGMGVPAAVAAAFRCPERQVVTLVGDGGFMMTGNELATAVQYELPIKILLSDNGAFGTIRTHQEKHFPGRISATALTNPDFAMMANAYGALGIDVSDSDQIGPALSQALEHHGPALINFHSSLEHISAYTTIAGLRNK